MTNTLYSNWHLSVMTEATCAEACWQAHEDVCRCSCGGRNHGIERTTGERPERTRRKQGRQYRLMAVTLDSSEAFWADRNDRRDFMTDYQREHPDAIYPNGAYFDGLKRYPHERVITNRATKAQHKWPEVQAVDGCADLNDLYRCNTYLIWERTDRPRTW